MGGFIDELELALLNHVFGKATYTPPANWFVGLSSTIPTDAGANFTEPVGGAYARVSTAAANWESASGTAPALIKNLSVVTFTAASATWLAGVELTYAGLFAASSGGTPKMWGKIVTPAPVLNGDIATFAAGEIKVKLGDPGDAY